MKYVIAEIDIAVNKDEVHSLETALRRIYKYINKNIDDTLPEDQFKKWCDSSDDKPLVWNKNRFYWSV